MSLSLRERGLKFLQGLLVFLKSLVALLARAWIEICSRLKDKTAVNVALLARAWIEIALIGGFTMTGFVALLARAWIEISSKLS